MLHPKRLLLLVLPACLVVTAPAAGQTSYPMITHTAPVALQRGQTAEMTVSGQMNFYGAYKVLFEGTGLSAEVVSGPESKAPPEKRQALSQVKLKVTAAPDAALGPREFRLATSLGISSIGQLVVVDAPVLSEKEANNTPDKANPISVPCVVHGQLEAAEDADLFKFQAAAGQTLTFEVFCARLQDKIHDLQKHADPMVTLYDDQGRELAANDDFYFADPLLAYTFPKAGDYFVQVRDSKYDGDRRWVYALAVTDKPYISNVYPMAGNPGQTLEVEPVGSARLKQPKVPLKVPAEAGLHTVQLDVVGTKTNPAAFYVSTLPQVQEPNDEPKQATRASVPCVLNGRIGARRDMDHFVFAARKGQAVRFEVKARRFGTPLLSSLDSLLEVLPASGNAIIASNDDAFGKDAALVFTPPQDGDFVLRVRDLNSKGGESFVYAVEADFARPDFTLRCDPDKAMMGPGSSAAWYVHVNRLNGFTGPVTVEVQGLPKGVSASPLTVPPTMTQGVVVLTAAADAPRDATNVQVVGTGVAQTPDGKEEKLVRPVTPNEEIYSPGGGRARFDVHLQSVAVTEPSDILKVDVKPQQMTLKPGQEVKIDVTIQRRADYTKDVTIDAVLSHLGGVFGNPLPPGVTVVEGKSKTALRSGNQGHITLKAAPTAAPIDGVPICVLAHVSINFVVKVSYASPPIVVSVQK